ncbi:MAG: hypothetical protein HY023_02060 [Chloroflexi bacterium]|nr:hypothetical protein [Chloroflexota bacterium]MBI3763758.1 hypothetical protein [Chloroflexota bacterium]
MFDNLRERSQAASPFDEEPPGDQAKAESETAEVGGNRLILGLNATQRLVLALMLFLNVAVLGCLCLMVTGAFSLPF